jgi:hypothetical protein
MNCLLLVLLLVIFHWNTQVIGLDALGMQECFKHDDCQNGMFCGWNTCTSISGLSYSCGTCRNCTECVCHSDSTDFECPANRCPASPTNGVRFLQGLFLSSFNMNSAPGYVCRTRLTISRITFTFMQIPVYTMHPSTTATLLDKTVLDPECPAFSRTGVLLDLNQTEDGVLHINITDLSKGRQHLSLIQALQSRIC